MFLLLDGLFEGPQSADRYPFYGTSLVLVCGAAGRYGDYLPLLHGHGLVEVFQHPSRPCAEGEAAIAMGPSAIGGLVVVHISVHMVHVVFLTSNWVTLSTQLSIRKRALLRGLSV